MPLPVLVQFHDFETIQSKASRLAAANGFQSAEGLLSMMGIAPSKLAKGGDRELAIFADWSAVDPEDLTKFLPINLPNRTVRLGGAVFSRSARRGNRFRYCPACIVDDVEHGKGRPSSRPFIRPGWTSSEVRNCTRHRRPLIDVSAPRLYRGDFCRYVSANLERISAQVQSSSSAELMEVDAYVEARIKGLETVPFLDRLEVYVVLDLCKHLGSFVHKYRQALTDLEPELWRAPMREIGFHVASRGDIFLRETFATIIRFKRDLSNSRTFFQSLGLWLRQHSKDEPNSVVVELLQDVAERNLPFAPGEICFVPVRRRYRHTVHSAAAEYRIARGRVISILNDAGLLKRRLNGFCCFDIETADALLSSGLETPGVTRGKAKEELGASLKLMKGIMKSNLLPRIRGSKGDRGHSIAIRDLTEFKQRVFKNVTIGDVDETALPIASIEFVTGVDPFDALLALIDGKLEKTMAEHDHGYRLDSLRFDRQEVLGHGNLSPKRKNPGVDGDSLHVTDAARLLRVKPKTIPQLIKLKLLDGSAAEGDPSSKGLMVTLASTTRFRKQYVVQKEAAEILRLKDAVFALEQTNGVRPVVKASPHTSAVYLRCDVLR